MSSAVNSDRVGLEPAGFKQEVIQFLQNRLRSERQYLAAQHRHLAEAAGCVHDLTLVHIALLENDINGTERLLKSVH